MKDNAMQIGLVLDRSGSMSDIEAATVEGTNAFLTEQQKGIEDVKLHFVQFDDKYETVYSGPVALAPHLTLDKQPTNNQVRFEPRGSTALLYAIGRTMDELGKSLEAMAEAERPAKVVVVIMTDGYENFSHHLVGADKKPLYDVAKIAEMIRVQREVYNWQFQFLGANQDVITTAATMNIPSGNAINFAASTMGTGNVMRATSRNVRAYGATGQAMSVNYVAEDRSRAMEQDEPEPAKP